MGVKRPFDEETIQELSFKQAKQLDGNNKPTSILEAIPEDISPHELSGKAANSGDAEGLMREPEYGWELEDDKTDKELETSAALSWVTSSSGEEEAGNGGAYFLPLYPDIFEFNIPRRAPIQFEDAYTDMLNSCPRKEVPVGPDYQANIPEWDPVAVRKDFLSSNVIKNDDSDQKLMGTSIFPMPDSVFSSSADVKTGYGRVDCDCLDRGSIRCVRQHVEEARRRLRKSIGDEKFAHLGFLDMGEEVALTWSEEEERLFHEVVYSNPISLGQNFWKHLSAVLPSRTKMELISYYFNVFILRRRAVQNRCDFLDIDSDDDEWQEDGRHTEVGGEDDDSVVESFGHDDIEVGHEIGVSNHIDDDREEESDEDDGDGDGDGNGDGDTDFGTNGKDAFDKDEHEEQLSVHRTEKSKDDSVFDSRVGNMDEVLSSNSKDHDVQAGIHTERHPFTMASCSSVGDATIIQANGLKSEHIRCSDGKSNGTTEGLHSGFILDTCDAKAWENTYPTSHTKSVDLLPTCNMIEEIFGQCTWKSN